MIPLIEQQRETGAGLSLAAMCRVLEVSRAAYYRARQPPAGDNETALRDAVQRIAVEMPAYGSRRITAELRRQGWVINRKRVQRMMRQDNLLCLRRKKFIRTTDSEHGLAVYPNLVPPLDISAVNQLWVADITYIRLLREFVYLAVVLDAFSRRVIGWSLGRTLEAELALAALRTALRTREIGPGLVHHSDRGVQYASGDYTKLSLRFFGRARLQRAAELNRRLEPLGRLLGERAHNNLRQPFRKRRIDRSRNGRVLLDVRLHDFELALALEQLAPGQQLVEDGAHGVDIRPLVEGGQSFDLLGRRVVKRPDHRARLSQARIRVHLRQPEVHQLERAFLG